MLSQIEAQDTTTTPTTPAVLSANGNGLSLTFTYTVAVPADGSTINMQGGMVEIEIPSGWTVPHATGVAADDDGSTVSKRTLLLMVPPMPTSGS